jgi:arginyl-tRNA synthetase
MKNDIKQLILGAARDAFQHGELSSDDFPAVDVEEPKLVLHGDFSTNFAMVSASVQKMAPKKIAQAVLKHLNDPNGIIQRTEIAGPGFINFYIHPEAWHPVLSVIHEKDAAYGATDLGGGSRVQVEFVSANPTGPLHVGHGRGAVVGDATAAILSFCGYDISREYYINDAGKQVHTLGRSVLLRARELSGQAIVFPEECYQGDYIRDIAKRILGENGDWLFSVDEEEAVSFCAASAAKEILAWIQEDLDLLGIRFDTWFSEQALCDSGKVDEVIRQFTQNKLIYEQDGARWFKTEDFGDEKDRVVVRNNGQTTYFASDIAYHQDKFDRGFERIIDVWGADHHGYIPRIRASIAASGKDPSRFTVILTQLVNLLRKGEPVAMGKRSGQFVTLREVIDEVGRDAARFIFLTRHYDSPLDFDLELAKQQTNDNPVFYVQYVHARISSILKKAAREKGATGIVFDPATVGRLTEPEEIQLIKHLARYPETIAESAEKLEPHRIAFYLADLAAAFHAYYNRHRVITDDPQLTAGRLYLVAAVRIIIRNGLHLLGVTAPESM